jgi:hypothetical protein
MRSSLFHKKFSNTLSSILGVVIPVLLLSMLVSTASAARQNEYERFGRKTVDTLISGDGKAFTEALNQEAVLDNVFEGISTDDKTVRELRKGLAMGLSRVGEVMVRNLSGANMKFLRSRNKGSERTALMRIDFGDKGLNYLDLILEKNKKGNIKIVDWYD